MLKTALHDQHVNLGANMVEYAGWHMPLSYRSVQEEHRHVRESGGIFDVSHMGRIRVSGRHARRLLERVCSRRISDMQQGQCRYSLICNEQGGVKDDVLVYRLDDDQFVVVVNAANRAKISDHFQSVAGEGEMKLSIDDETEKTAMVALQGPKVMDLISRVSQEIPTLKRYRFTVKNVLIAKLIVSRTGYTGEDGVEVILPNGAVGMALKLLMKDTPLGEPDSFIQPAGLAARDTLRLEAGMPLYGHELSEDLNALSCGVDFAIKLDKGDDDRGETFIGQDALKRTAAEGGPAQKIVGLRFDAKRTPRQGMPVTAGGEVVGGITSGCLSPTLGHPIAMALVTRDAAEKGGEIEVDTGKATLSGEICPLPFYSRK